MAHGFSSGFWHGCVWAGYGTTVCQFGNFLPHNDSSWCGPVASSKATLECAAWPGEGAVLLGGTLSPSLAAKPQAQARASTSGYFVEVKGAGGDSGGIWREGLPVHSSQVLQRPILTAHPSHGCRIRLPSTPTLRQDHPSCIYLPQTPSGIN